MATKIELEVLGFTGFYQGIWNQSENEYVETRELKYADIPDIDNFRFIDDWGFDDDYRDKVAELFGEEYEYMINDMLGLNLTKTGVTVDSPKYYNFSTDRIFVEFEVEDYDTMISKLQEYASDPTNRAKLEKLIKDNHTSYDGFMSFMSNDINEWDELIADPTDSRYISCLIQYLLYINDRGRCEYLNEAMYIMASENLYHETNPKTDEARKELELYYEYGDEYINFLNEHEELAWEELVEQFEEQCQAKKDYEIWKSNQPVITGLFD